MSDKKTYPPTVTLKSTLLIVALVAMGIIVSLIFYNLFHSIHQIKNTDKLAEKVISAKSLSTAVDMNWYKNEQTKKPVSATFEPVVTANANNKKDKNNVATVSNTVLPQEAEDLQKAMRAAISSNQITGEQNPQLSQTSPSNGLSYSSAAVPSDGMAISQNQTDDQNMQAEKKAFLQKNKITEEDGYLHNLLNNPVSRYEIKAGTIIPSLLITGVNSDLPGQITGQVRTNVYDTATGRYLLIPQGAKIIGVYDSQISYGQERLLVAWKRILFPNGKSIDLDGMPGVDLSGYAGFNDEVNHHYRKIFGSVLLMSFLGAGAQLSQPQQSFSNNASGGASSNGQLSVGQIIAQSVGSNIANAGTMVFQKKYQYSANT